MLRPPPMSTLFPCTALFRSAAARLALVAAGLVLALVLDVPDGGEMTLVLGLGALPWSLLVLVAALRDPELTLNPVVGVVDLALLVALEAVAPDSYGAVRFIALFLIAVHSHLQGERRGLAVASIGVAAIVAGTLIRGEAPAMDGLLALYETLFGLSALATAVVVGRLRTSESASRLR